MVKVYVRDLGGSDKIVNIVEASEFTAAQILAMLNTLSTIDLAYEKLTLLKKQSDANEGGEFHLETSTNTNLSAANVVVDLFHDADSKEYFRIFENGGTFRGAKIDIAGCAAGAGTQFAPYTTGTWTPSDTSGAGLSLTGAAGLYTKLGNLVIASATFAYPATANGSNSKIGGLPFASNSGSGAVRQGQLTYTTSSTANKILLGVAGSTDFQFYTAPGVAVTNANMSGTTNWVQCIYPV